MLIDGDSLNYISQIKTFEDRVYEASIFFAGIGIPILPLKKNSKILLPSKDNINYTNATTDEKIIDGWFNPKFGKYAGFNIGAGCGKFGSGGIFVIDVDKHGNKDGFETWGVLLKQHKELGKTIIQQTPNNGNHYIYQHFKGGKSSVDKLGLGIDTRGGVGGIKSHIVMFPSVVDGKEYSIIKTGKIAPLPESMLKYVVSKIPNQVPNNTNPNKGDLSGRGNENIGDDDVLTAVTPDDVISMLSAIDINSLDYESWVKIGMAIYHSNINGGLGIWEQWSKKGKRYKLGECIKRWNGFKRDIDDGSTNVSIATLIYFAKNAGWSPPMAELAVDDTPTKKSKKTKNKSTQSTGLVEQFNSKCFVDVSSNRFKVCILPQTKKQHLRVLSRTDFIHCYENRLIDVLGKQKNPANLWLSSNKRLELYGFYFAPDETPGESRKKGYYNLFTGFPYNPIEHKSKGVDFFIKFVNDVICDGDKILTEWVLDWWADLFQNPADPKGTAIVLIGEEGVGKGAMVTLIAPLLGKYFSKDNGGFKISGRFNGFLETSILLFVDEMTKTVGAKVQQTLKALITGNDLLIESKGLDVKSVVAVARVIIASNDYEVIRGEKTSRRYLSLEVSNSKICDHLFFDKLFSICSGDEFAEDMMHFFVNRDIGSGYHLRKAPSTTMLEKQKIAHITDKNNILLWLIHLIDNGSLGLIDVKASDNDITGWSEYIDRVLFKLEYERWCIGLKLKSISSIPFFRTIRSLGFEDIRVKKHSVVVRALKTPTIKDLKELISLFIGVGWNTINQ